MIYNPPPRGKLSEHFDWSEVTHNSGYLAVPLGPFRLPNGQWVRPRVNARKHARNLEKLRRTINYGRALRKLPETGIYVLSWARSWEHNKTVGGALDSQHLYFLATDISLQEIDRLCPWPNGREDFDNYCNMVFALGGFGTYPAGNRHVDSRSYRARWNDWVGWGRK